jgi:hypothetical protein
VQGDDSSARRNAQVALLLEKVSAGSLCYSSLLRSSHLKSFLKLKQHPYVLWERVSHELCEPGRHLRPEKSHALQHKPVTASSLKQARERVFRTVRRLGKSLVELAEQGLQEEPLPSCAEQQPGQQEAQQTLLWQQQELQQQQQKQQRQQQARAQAQPKQQQPVQQPVRPVQQPVQQPVQPEDFSIYDEPLWLHSERP